MTWKTSGVVSRPRRVLVVDDDDDWRDVLTALLEQEGYTVMSAVNGLDALNAIDAMHEPPDAILLDLMMPQMDGWDFMEALTSRPQVSAVPIIVASASHDPRAHGLEVPFLRKPVDIDELLAHVAGSVCRQPVAESV